MEEEIEYTDVPVGAIVTALIAGIVGTLGIKKIVKIRKARRLKKDRELLKFTEEYAAVMERAARRLEYEAGPLCRRRGVQRRASHGARVPRHCLGEPTKDVESTKGIMVSQ